MLRRWRDVWWRTRLSKPRQRRKTLLTWVKAPLGTLHKAFTFVISQPRVVARPGSFGSCNGEAERRGAAGGSRPKLSAWPWTTRRGTEPAAMTTRSTPISTSSSATAERRPLTRRTRSRTWNSRVSGGTFDVSSWFLPPFWLIFFVHLTRLVFDKYLFIQIYNENILESHRLSLGGFCKIIKF